MHSIRQIGFVDTDRIIAAAARRRYAIAQFCVDPLEQSVRMGVTDFGIVLENVEPARRHLAAGGKGIVLDHVFERLPEQFEIGFGEAGLLGTEGGYEATRAVQAVRHGVD